MTPLVPLLLYALVVADVGLVASWVWKLERSVERAPKFRSIEGGKR